MNYKKIPRLIIGLAVIILVTACRGSEIEPVTTLDSSSAWFLRQDMSNIGIITLDFQTLQLKAAYITTQVPCDEKHPPVSDEELKSRAGGLFDATGKYWSRRIIEDESGEREELAFEVSRIGDFAVLEIEPGDFGGFAVSHPCSGLVLYAGSIVWSGRGEQIYPAVPIRSAALKRTSRQTSPPEQVDVVIGPYASGDEENGIAAWNSIQDLNLIQELASAPYSVLVYLYPRTVGMFNPNNADWVIFVHRGPVPEPGRHLVPTSTPWPTRLSPIPTAPSLSSPLQTPSP